MGLPGSGKTTVGKFLTRRLKAVFIDADDHHSVQNIIKMSNGYPLNDLDRKKWLLSFAKDIYKLKIENKAFRVEKYKHSYPNCWRTDKPILYYPIDSWFISTSKYRNKMVSLNKKINWKPKSTGEGRFEKWLENVNDWNLSRSRFWGIPLPIWRTEDGSEEVCIGSVKDLYEEINKSVCAGFMKEHPLHPTS